MKLEQKKLWSFIMSFTFICHIFLGMTLKSAVVLHDKNFYFNRENTARPQWATELPLLYLNSRGTMRMWEGKLCCEMSTAHTETENLGTLIVS